MTKQTEALKLALEALNRGESQLRWIAIAAIEEVLAQPEQITEKEKISREMTAEIVAMRSQPKQEPVAWITPDGEGFRIRFSPPTSDVPLGWDALYTTPPKRTWVGLTDEQIYDAVRPLCNSDEVAKCLIELSIDEYRAIEAKLKEKNT